MLDAKQLGAIRHLRNLSQLPYNDWTHMQSYDTFQFGHQAYRYQLAYGAFALGLAHRHRLPNAPAVFKETFDGLIRRMLEPAVWLYWRDTSQGAGPLTMDAPRLESEADPVRRDNIMYSGYVQAMTLMYHALFNDDKYAQEGAISFKYQPLSGQLDKVTKFQYTEDSLNELIYRAMVENGYLGVACEPYCIFQICNQVPILAFRLHDYIHGGSRSEEVTEGYKKAWGQFGLVDENGYHPQIYLKHLRYVAGMGYYGDAWTNMLMNAWNSEFVHQQYADQVEKWIKPGRDGACSVNFKPPADPGAEVPPHVVAAARAMARLDLADLPPFPAGAGADFGFIAACASEMGDHTHLSGLLTHADRYMNPQWVNGGYFYPRNDQSYDADGNFTGIGPTEGNALLAYARLNVPNGLKQLYEQPWTPGHFDEPLVTAISDNADLSQARYDPATRTLTVTAQSSSQGHDNITLRISNVVDSAGWSATLDEAAVDATGAGIEGDQLVVSMTADKARTLQVTLS